METNTNPNLVLGTAGHIDHGKSALVQALTGVDPDTLAEEKERGITIELGWAQLKLPDGRKMTVVDVPGHEKFVRQMIVGAAGVDVALLVIAADDGVMPQTVEHVAVLQTLGIRACVVALTKIDLVDKEWLSLVQEDVRAFLQSTPYANARIVPCSNRTGEGVEDVRVAIAEAVNEAPKVHRGEALRQPVHRAFTVKGVGTVVTGVVWSGVAKPGDSVEVLPSGERGRIRGVQVHGKAVKEAYAGNCVAINITDLPNDKIEGGDFICTPGTVQMSDRFDCYFTYIDTSGANKPLVSGVKMHIAHGAKEILGRVLLADGQGQLASGCSCYAQIRLDEPLPVSCYDRFIARTYSPVRVAGGGQILTVRPKKRTTLGDERAMLDAVCEGRFQEAVELELASRRFPCSAAEIAAFFGTDASSMKKCLQSAVESGKALTLGSGERWFITQQKQDELIETMEQELKAFHDAQPAEPGMKKETLRQQCFPRLEADRFDALVSLAVSLGKMAVNKGLVGHSSAQAYANQAQEEAEAALLACLKRDGIVPLELPEMAKENGLTLPLARRAVAVLCERGEAYRVNGDLYFSTESIEELKRIVAEQCAQEGGAGIGELREAMGINRKRAVAVLEAFDLEEYTERIEDRRIIKA